MAITPNTAFTQGQVFTADQANRFPRGIMGGQTLTTAFTTSATHTTFQDTGMSLTITEEVGRIYRIYWTAQIFPSGGLQGMVFRFMRGATFVSQMVFAAVMLDAANSTQVYGQTVYTSTASGSATWKVQMAALTNNTAVQQYADGNYPRQFGIEDIGAS